MTTTEHEALSQNGLMRSKMKAWWDSATACFHVQQSDLGGELLEYDGGPYWWSRHEGRKCIGQILWLKHPGDRTMEFRLIITDQNTYHVERRKVAENQEAAALDVVEAFMKMIPREHLLLHRMERLRAETIRRIMEDVKALDLRRLTLHNDQGEDIVKLEVRHRTRQDFKTTILMDWDGNYSTYSQDQNGLFLLIKQHFVDANESTPIERD